MGSSIRRMEKTWGCISAISAKDALLWLGTLAAIGGLTTFILQSQADNCMSWYEDNHAVLLRLIGEPNSGCATAKDATACSIRARRALDELSKDRSRADPFAISNGACAAIRVYADAL